MSNKDRVESVVRGLMGSVRKHVTLDQVVARSEGLTRDQVSKALRSLSLVKPLGKGRYGVRGRYVP